MLIGLGTKVTIQDARDLPGLKLAVSTAEFLEGDNPDEPTVETITVTASLDVGTNGGRLTEAVTVSVEVPDGGTFYTIVGTGWYHCNRS